MSAIEGHRGKILIVFGHLMIVVIGIALGTASAAVVIGLSGGTPILLCTMVPFLLVGAGRFLLVRSRAHPEQEWKRVLGLSVWGGVLISLVVFELMIYASFDTKYAPGYSEEAFQSIQIGNTKEEVLERLGEPLLVFGINDEILRYAESPTGSHYLMRDIVLDPDGRVMEIRHEIYWD